MSPHCGQRDRDRRQVFIQVVSRCSACPPRELPSRSGCPQQALPPPCSGAEIPLGFPSPSVFPPAPVSFSLGLSCLLLQREFGGQADGSPEQTIPLEQHLGVPGCQGTCFCPRILHRNQTIITLFPDKRITFNPRHPTKRIISGLVLH